MKGVAAPQEAYVGVGANLDDPVRQVRQALRELNDIPFTHVAAYSSLYRTLPVGYLDQPPFINAVARLETRLEPRALLAELRQIEDRHGRQRNKPNGPRTLDLDLLTFADRVVSDRDLTLPHSRMHERAFVLVPLAEISADAEMPGRGRVADLLEQLDRSGVEKIGGAVKIGVA